MPTTIPINRLLTSTNSPAAAPFSDFVEELVGAANEDEKPSLDEGEDDEGDISKGSEDCTATEV